MANDQSSPTTSLPTSPIISKHYAGPIRIAVIAFFLLIVFGGPIEHLLFGWLYFLLRVVPQISVDWPTAILGVLCSIAFVATLHASIKWFRAANVSSNAASQPWRLRSTVIVATLLLLLFVAGTAMVGATHQFIWLLASRSSTPADKAARAQLRVPALSYAVYEARESARRTQAKNTLKQLGLAMHNCADMDGSLPPGGVVLSDGTPMHGWAIRLNGCTTFYSHEIDWSVPWNQPPNQALYQCQLFEFVNVALEGPLFDDEGYGFGHFAGNVNVFPIRSINVGEIADKTPESIAKLIHSSSGTKLQDITDGTSNTIMLGTVIDRLKPWGDPMNVRDPALGVNRSPDGFGGPAQWHGGLFLMCDGSVRFLDEKTDPGVMRALGTPASGDAIPREYQSDQ